MIRFDRGSRGRGGRSNSNSSQRRVDRTPTGAELFKDSMLEDPWAELVATHNHRMNLLAQYQPDEKSTPSAHEAYPEPPKIDPETLEVIVEGESSGSTRPVPSSDPPYIIANQELDIDDIL